MKKEARGVKQHKPKPLVEIDVASQTGSLGFRMVEPKSTANGANSREKK